MKISAKSRLKRARWLAGFLLSLAVTLIVGLLYFLKAGEQFELRTIDLRFRLRGPLAPSKNVDIIFMDDACIDVLGRWPWRRIYHAMLVTSLIDYKPAAICYDVLFTEPATDFPEDDRMLAKVSADARNTYYPFFFTIADKGGIPQKSAEKISAKIKNMAFSYVPRPSDRLYRAEEMTAPIPQLLSALKGTGFVNAVPDADGVTRRVPLVIECGGKLFPSLAFRVVCDYLGVKANDVSVCPGRHIELKETRYGPVKIPVDEKCQMLVNFAGGIEAFRWHSFIQVLKSYQDIQDGKKPAIALEELGERILFVGLTATGTVDIRPTPFSPTYPLVGVLANTASNIITRDFLSVAPDPVNIFVLLALGIAVGLVAPRLKPVTGALFAFLLLAVYLAGAYYVFIKGLCLTVLYPSIVVILGYGVIVIYKFATEEKEKKWIKNVFQRYVTSQVVDELLSDTDKLALGGKRKELTVLFADIRGFTTMSEGMRPEDVVAMLNEFFTMITDVIFKYKGTLDKFMGDAVMAIYGAPVEQSDHAERAVRTAFEIQQNMKVSYDNAVKKGQKPVSMGIGINTGDVVVGNIGSLQRMEYTVIGDEVNLASRIQGVSSGGQILITDKTYEKVKDVAEVNKLEPVKVKGKANLIRIYEVTGIR